MNRLVFLTFVLSSIVYAQTGLPPALRGVGIDQKLNEQVPLDLRFRDESGKAVRLGDYFGRKPVILTLVYYDCPMLCTLVLNDLLRALRVIPLHVGEQFDVVTVSFNPRDTTALAAAKKREYIERYGRPNAAKGWHFLTGDDEPIRQLTRAVGFRYTFDPQSGQYAHASGIMILTPEGRLARYFYGLEYSARDVRLSLVEASANRIGSRVDEVLLFCFHYDPTTGRYGVAIMNALRVAGIGTALGLGAFLLLLFGRERRVNGC